MEAYRYEAFDADGRAESGVIHADSPRHARTLLRGRQLFPSAVDLVRVKSRNYRFWDRGISTAELSLLTRQLAILLESGLTVEQALNALIEESDIVRTREILSGVKSEVLAGLSLSAAMAHSEGSFPDFYRALVHGGEESGALPTVLVHLADYLDARQALKQKTSLALLYPLLVTVVAVAIVLGLLTYVVPQVVQVFQQSRQALPWLTRALIATSGFLREFWPYLVALAAGSTLAARAALRRPALRRHWDGWLLRIPGLGPIIRGSGTSRFASTLAVLVGGGVPLLAAMAASARVTTNVVMREAIESAIGSVREGGSLARALGASKVFPMLLIHLITSGEVTGKLEQMLKRAAQLETQSFERRLAVFVTLLEPVMILFMGAVVLLIVLAILLPIIEINQLVR